MSGYSVPVFLHHEGLEDVALLDVIELCKSNSAFKTGGNLFNIILEAAQGGNLVLRNNNSVADNADLCVPCNLTLKNIASGDFSGGFERAENFEPASAEVRIFSPAENEDANLRSVILIPDKRADSVEYIPYMKFLAAKGFKVYSGDFFVRDGKWFNSFADFRIFRKIFMRINYFQNPVKFEMQKEFYSFNSEREVKAMLDFVLKEQKSAAEPVFLAGDWMSDICFDDFASEKLPGVSGFFKLSGLPEYSSKGFGFVQQTSPFTAFFLNLEREPDLENLKIIVEKTVEAIPGGTDDTE